MERHLVSVAHMRDKILARLRRIKWELFPPRTDDEGTIDLVGDRDIEWSFIASRLPHGSGDVLDFGCGSGSLSIHAVRRGLRVLALDLELQRFPWSHPNLEIRRGDLLTLDFGERRFDFVLTCSTIEHVGLTGRYGVLVEETDGDLLAMQKLRRLLKPSGRMLLTLPCGLDAAVVPWHRVYGQERLPKLFAGFETEEEEYWAKQGDNRWYPAIRTEALSYAPTAHPTLAHRCSYALGCFVLRPN